MATWKFIVTSLTYHPQGELLDVYDVEIARRLNGIDTLSFRIRSNNRFFSYLVAQEAYIKAYRDGQLQFIGEVFTSTIIGSENKADLNVVCQSEGYKLAVMNGYPSAGPENMSDNVSVDRGRYLYTSMFYAQRINPFGWSTSAHPATDPAGTPQYKHPGLFIPYFVSGNNVQTGTRAEQVSRSVADVLSLTSNGSLGFDWYWKPTEPTWVQINSTDYPIAGNNYVLVANRHIPGATNEGVYIRSISEMQLANTIGTYQQGTFFEFNMGKQNLAGYTFVASKEFLANAFFDVNPDKWRPGMNYGYTGTRNDTPSQYAWGRRAVFTATSSETEQYQPSITAQSLALRKNPRRRIEIEVRKYFGVAGDPPSFGTDFNLGDTVNVRIAAPDGTLLVNGVVRVYGVTFSMGEGASETVKLTIEEQ